MKTIHATTVLALTSVLVLAAFRLQGPGGLAGQVINGCEIDLRPKSRPEAQIYYRELTTVPKGGSKTDEDLDAGIYGCEFDVRVGMNGALELGVGDASTVVAAKAGGPNIVRLLMDTNTAMPQYRITIQWPEQVIKSPPVYALDLPTTGRGAFDPLGLFQDPPTVESVRREDGDPKKGRIRITAITRGVGLSFTVGDA